jgi:hypothetical protein
MTAIATKDLSKTFQDAIYITRLLGIQYIWIDALCIIQDSELDWKRESAQMFHIYSSSYCNLAASSARDGSQGMLYHRDNKALQPLKLFVNDMVCFIEPTTKSMFEANVEHGPLTNRAWVFQERMLSKRNLHFTSKHLLWECNSFSTFEGSVLVDVGLPKRAVPSLSGEETNDLLSSRDPSHITAQLIPATNAPASLPEFSTVELPQKRNHLIVSARFKGIKHQRLNTEKLYSEWDSLVDTYSTTKLTEPTDKLIALGGLAESWQQQLQDEYFAGLWRMNLIRGLLWHVGARSELHDQHANPARYVAPSWSWASIIGRVETLPAYINILKSLAVVLDVVIESTGPSKFGQLKAGYIDLHGRIARVKVDPVKFQQERDRHNAFLIPLRNEAVHPRDSVSVTIDVAAHDAPTAEADYWYLMPLAMCQSSITSNPELFGLVLREIEPRLKRCRRIGLFRCGGSQAESKIKAISIAYRSFTEHANNTELDYEIDDEGYSRYFVQVI